jgi:hypothetical protein
VIPFLSRFRRRHEELDARVDSATARAEKARGEADKSRERQESVRENVVAPLQRAAQHNQFADLIRRSLTEGNGGP